MTALTQTERVQLARLEAVIAAGIGAFFEVGKALERVRDQRLYRQTHDTFEAYCAERWGFSRRHAYRLIDAAEVVEDVTARSQTAPPQTEMQARALVKLPSDRRAEVWERAVESDPDGAPTAAEVGELAREAFEALPPGERLRVVRQAEEAAARKAEGRQQARADHADERHRERAIWHATQAIRHARARTAEDYDEAVAHLGRGVASLEALAGAA